MFTFGGFGNMTFNLVAHEIGETFDVSPSTAFDRFDGGAGNDAFQNITGGSFDINLQTGVVDGTADVLTNFENFIGNGFDTIHGGTSLDTIDAGLGNDVVNGGGANDHHH